MANWGCTRGIAQVPESSLHKSKVSSSGDTGYSMFFYLWTKLLSLVSLVLFSPTKLSACLICGHPD